MAETGTPVSERSLATNSASLDLTSKVAAGCMLSIRRKPSSRSSTLVRTPISSPTTRDQAFPRSSGGDGSFNEPSERISLIIEAMLLNCTPVPSIGSKDVYPVAPGSLTGMRRDRCVTPCSGVSFSRTTADALFFNFTTIRSPVMFFRISIRKSALKPTWMASPE